MRTIFILLFTGSTLILNAQKPQKKVEALVAPKVTEREITVGGERADYQRI